MGAALDAMILTRAGVQATDMVSALGAFKIVLYIHDEHGLAGGGGAGAKIANATEIDGDPQMARSREGLTHFLVYKLFHPGGSTTIALDLISNIAIVNPDLEHIERGY